MKNSFTHKTTLIDFTFFLGYSWPGSKILSPGSELRRGTRDWESGVGCQPSWLHAFFLVFNLAFQYFFILEARMNCSDRTLMGFVRELLGSQRARQRAALLAFAILAPACGGGSHPGAIVFPFGVATGSLPNGVVATPYNQTLAAVSGTAPLTWSILLGSLPPGLALAPATGVISGTPTGTANVASFTVRVTDANAATAGPGGFPSPSRVAWRVS